MLRTIVFSIVCLGVGVVANVLVAWTCAFAGSEPMGRAGFEGKPYAILAWPGPVPGGWPDPLITGYAGSWWGGGEPLEDRLRNWWRESGKVTADQSPRAFEGIGGGRLCTYTVELFGFPFRALRRDSLTELAGFTAIVVPQNTGWQFGVDAPPWLAGQLGLAARVPIMPLWRGFVANTVVFAIVAWPVAWGCWRGCWCVVGRLRQGHGRCVQCGYAVKGLAACPECGTEVASVRDVSMASEQAV